VTKLCLTDSERRGVFCFGVHTKIANVQISKCSENPFTKIIHHLISGIITGVLFNRRNNLSRWFVDIGWLHAYINKYMI
jgi:hypothetical protein